ncbi:MAG: hypothetical protein IPN77_33410 [Sandaracinaceae bacterium]|nr:hypothetical protein [Sandaracinaceae bacterium]
MLTSAYTDSRVQALEDQLVRGGHRDRADLESATLAEAQAYRDAHSPMVGPVTSDLTVTALEGMDTLTHEDAIAYGAKAANLGELHAILPAANRVEGFGIPFSAYRDFIEHNNIDADITALLADPQVDTDQGYRQRPRQSARRHPRRRAAARPSAALGRACARSTATGSRRSSSASAPAPTPRTWTSSAARGCTTPSGLPGRRPRRRRHGPVGLPEHRAPRVDRGRAGAAPR